MRLVSSPLRITFSAVYWSCWIGLEWNFTFILAFSANCLVHIFLIHSLFQLLYRLLQKTEPKKSCFLRSFLNWHVPIKFMCSIVLILYSEKLSFLEPSPVSNSLFPQMTVFLFFLSLPREFPYFSV